MQHAKEDALQQDITTQNCDMRGQKKQAIQKQASAPITKQSKMIGPYQMGEVVGRGACGKVFKGLNFETGQLVAIKQIRINNFKEEKKQQLQMEINLLKKLEHPNIVKYIDSLYTDHYLNIILEYVENGSLDSINKKFGKVPEPLAAIYIQQVLQGLDYLHSQGVIHRDIKGGNILTTKDGIVKLADFGVATKLAENEKQNSVVGTPYWMAPEVIEMSGQVTTACDIWSLGCTVIELLTTNPPYSSLHPCTAMIKIVQEPMPPIPDSISDELRDFLHKCFEKEPFKRVDAKGLIQHPWLKKFDTRVFQNILRLTNSSTATDNPHTAQQHISSQALPEAVSTTIIQHITQQEKRNSLLEQSVNDQYKHIHPSEPQSVVISVSSSVKAQSPRSKTSTVQQQSRRVTTQSDPERSRLSGNTTRALNQGRGISDEDDCGEIGELGEEVARNDMNDVPIERTKCLSNINSSDHVEQQDKQYHHIQSNRQIARTMNTSTVNYNQQAANMNDAFDQNNKNLNSTAQVTTKKVPQQQFLQSQQFHQSQNESQFQSIQNNFNQSMQNPGFMVQGDNFVNSQQFIQQNVQLSKHKSTANSKSSGIITLETQVHVNQSIHQRPATGVIMPGSLDISDSMFQQKQHMAQNAAMIQLQHQQQKQVFDVQGNRQVFYLTKKSQGKIPNESQSAGQELQNNVSQRQQRRNEQTGGGKVSSKVNSNVIQDPKILQSEQIELLQQQQYQQQQRETMARYHKAAMHNPPLSTGVMVPTFNMGGFHAHPKAKSNDMMISNPKHIRQPQPFQTMTPGALSVSNQFQQIPLHQQALQTQYQSAKNNREKFQESSSSQSRFQTTSMQNQFLNSQGTIPDNLNTSQMVNSYGSRLFRQQQQQQHISTQQKRVSDRSPNLFLGNPSDIMNIDVTRNLSPINSSQYNIQQQLHSFQLQPSNSGITSTQMMTQDFTAESDSNYEQNRQLFNQQLLHATNQSRQQPINNSQQQFHSAGNNSGIGSNLMINQEVSMFPRNQLAKNQAMIFSQNGHQRFGSQYTPDNNNNLKVVRNQMTNNDLQSDSIRQQMQDQNNIATSGQYVQQAKYQQQPQIIPPEQPGNNNAESSFDNYFETLSNNNNVVGIKPNSPRTYEGNEEPVVTVLMPQNKQDEQQIRINMNELNIVRESFIKRQHNAVSNEDHQDRTNMQLMVMMAALSPDKSSGESQRRKGSTVAANVLQRPQDPLNSQQQYLIEQHQQFKQIDSMMATNIIEESQNIVEQIKNAISEIEGNQENKIEERKTSNNYLDTEENYPESDTDVLSPEQKLANDVTRLTQMLKEYCNEPLKEQIVNSLNYTTIIQMLNLGDEMVYCTLQLINQICENCPKHQEMISVCGLIPHLIKFSKAFYPKEVSIEVAYFIGQIYQFSPLALQIFISNSGLSILIEFLDFEYEENKDVIMLAIDSFLVLYNDRTSLLPCLSVEDLSFIFHNLGLVYSITKVIPKIIHSIETSTVLNEHSQAERYLERAFDVLQHLLASNCNAAKLTFCEEKVIKECFVKVIQNTLNDPTPITLTIIKRFMKLIQQVTTCQATFKELEKHDFIKLIVDLFQFLIQDTSHLQLQLVYEILKMMSVLCKLSPSRTQQAAMASFLAPTKQLILYLFSRNEISRSKKVKLLRQILQIVQEFIVTSAVTRQLLTGYQYQFLLLQIIQEMNLPPQANNQEKVSTSKDQTIIAKVLDLYALWLQTENTQIEQFLAQRNTLDTFFNIFIQNPRTKTYIFVFNALNRLLSISSMITKSLASHPQLVEKLAQQLNHSEYQLSNSLQASNNRPTESARSDFGEKNTIEGVPDNGNSKSAQQAQVMKELMEIFQNLIKKSELGASQMNLNMIRLFEKVQQTSENNNLVILSSIAQNILQSCGSHMNQSKQAIVQHHQSRSNTGGNIGKFGAQQPMVFQHQQQNSTPFVQARHHHTMAQTQTQQNTKHVQNNSRAKSPYNQ